MADEGRGPSPRVLRLTIFTEVDDLTAAAIAETVEEYVRDTFGVEIGVEAPDA